MQIHDPSEKAGVTAGLFIYYEMPSIVAATSAAAAMMSHISVNFQTNRTHLMYGMPETARTPMSEADVGMIVFVIASPY